MGTINRKIDWHLLVFGVLNLAKEVQVGVLPTRWSFFCLQILHFCSSLFRSLRLLSLIIFLTYLADGSGCKTNTVIYIGLGHFLTCSSYIVYRRPVFYDKNISKNYGCFNISIMFTASNLLFYLLSTMQTSFPRHLTPYVKNK